MEMYKRPRRCRLAKINAQRDYQMVAQPAADCPLQSATVIVWGIAIAGAC